MRSKRGWVRGWSSSLNPAWGCVLSPWRRVCVHEATPRAETARYVVNIRRLRRLRDGVLRRRSLPKEQKIAHGTVLDIAKNVVLDRADAVKSVAYEASYMATMHEIKKHGF